MTYELFSMWQNLGEVSSSRLCFGFSWLLVSHVIYRVLGENKIHFIPGMIGPFLGVTLVPQLELRNIMIPIFHDMMDWEQRKNGNFKQVKVLL